MDLKDSVAVVTGSARGIGRAIAEAFIARGARVAMVDIMAEELDKTAGELESRGAVVLPVVTDITSVSQVEAMVSNVRSELGPIDIHVNNAGTFSYIGPVWEAEPEKWFRDIRVNLFGGFLCCREIVGDMVRRGKGYVINMVSAGGVGDPHPYSTSYAASKTALMRLTEGLAKEVEEYGVKVFALAPPAMDTAMTRFIMDDPGGKKWRPGFEKHMRKSQPPALIGELAVKLVSGRADALTGRFFLATRDFDEIVASTETILKDDLMTLRIR
ncbi:MAG: SDR family oxidoreductase [Phycisphaerae bacterium]|nr:SDR family oxidoreductase [Phycisphaerae bacterium]